MKDMFEPKNNMYCNCKYCVQNCIHAIKKPRTLKDNRKLTAQAEECKNYKEL